MLKDDIKLVEKKVNWYTNNDNGETVSAFNRIKKFIEEAGEQRLTKQSTPGCSECGCRISLKGYCAGCQTRVG